MRLFGEIARNSGLNCSPVRDVDRPHRVGQPAFLEHDRYLPAVRRRPVEEFDRPLCCADRAARAVVPADLRFADGAVRFCAGLRHVRCADRSLRTEEGFVTRADFLLPANGFVRPGASCGRGTGWTRRKHWDYVASPISQRKGEMTRFFVAAIAIAFLAATPAAPGMAQTGEAAAKQEKKISAQQQKMKDCASKWKEEKSDQEREGAGAPPTNS